METTLSTNEEKVLSWLKAHEREVLELTAQLISVPSVTGDEGLITPLLVDVLEKAGLSPEVDHVTEEFRDAHPNFADELQLSSRPNVYGWYRSRSRTVALPVVINGHVDVVPAGELDRWTVPPFSGDRRDGKIWGRGAADMKGPIAAGLIALKALQTCDIDLPFDVQIQLVIGEETGGIGSLFAIQTQPRPQAVIVLEPSENKVVAAGGGSVQFTVSAVGRASHGCIPWTGISAIQGLVDCYIGLKEFAKSRNEKLYHPLFANFPEPAPYSIGTFDAGSWRITVSESGNFSGRIGILPGESRDDIRRQLAEEIETFRTQDEFKKDADLSISWPNPGFAPWQTDLEGPLVSAMRSAAATIGDGAVVAVTYGSDAGHFAEHGIPVVIFGPGSIVAAHMTDEYIAEADLHQAAAVLAVALIRLGSDGAATTRQRYIS